jgi:TPR repeat protein
MNLRQRTSRRAVIAPAFAVILGVAVWGAAPAAFAEPQCAKAAREEPALQGIAVMQMDPRRDDRALAAKAQAGDVAAMDQLGEQILGDGGSMFFMDSWGRPAESVKWWKRAAARGDTKAMILLGHLYSEPWGVPQDLPTAVRWFNRAADKGRSEGAEDLVRLYRGEWSDASDEAKAAYWLRRVVAMCGQPPKDPRPTTPLTYTDPATRVFASRLTVGTSLRSVRRANFCGARIHSSTRGCNRTGARAR